MKHFALFSFETLTFWALWRLCNGTCVVEILEDQVLCGVPLDISVRRLQEALTVVSEGRQGSKEAGVSSI